MKSVERHFEKNQEPTRDLRAFETIMLIVFSFGSTLAVLLILFVATR